MAMRGDRCLRIIIKIPQRLFIVCKKNTVEKACRPPDALLPCCEPATLWAKCISDPESSLYVQFIVLQISNS